MLRLPKFLHRKPDFIIGSKDDPYLLRWWVIPRNRFFNIYLHKFLHSDDDRALHDHPWVSCSILLSGRYLEHTPDNVFLRTPFKPIFRRAKAAHRVELLSEVKWVFSGATEPYHDAVCDHNGFLLRPKLLPVPVWTLFLTGPRQRAWGFHCPKGWIPWWEFTAKDNPGDVGAGCGE